MFLLLLYFSCLNFSSNCSPSFSVNIFKSSSDPMAFILNYFFNWSSSYCFTLGRSWITCDFIFSIYCSANERHSLRALSPSALHTYPQADSTLGTLPPLIRSTYAFANCNNYVPLTILPWTAFGRTLLKILDLASFN
jgi:hypothetical protein